jgi:hypothetical protein
MTDRWVIQKQAERREMCSIYGSSSPPWGNATDPNATIITAINDATAALNATIEQAIAATHATDVKIVISPLRSTDCQSRLSFRVS